MVSAQTLMKYVSIVAVCSVVVVSLWLLIANEPADAPQPPETGTPVVTIAMGDSGYSTTSIRVAVGDTIAFENVGTRERWPASDLHPTHELYSEFDPRAPLSSGELWAFRFTRCGMWRFHDHLAPNIRGVITVLCEQ